MSTHRAQLSSVATTLDELTQRITDAADHYQDAAKEDVASDLYEVERALQAAGRRLENVVTRLD
jgi:hypothetical protein